ncbi:ribosomal RNA large subunit methyltransferase E [Galdieria sulphuraria]|uniref:rRNA methyltransferase 2, mitochondrial n=1 Tax=Galdieria sulphuraria TaxID=130081 RepID=M2XDN1_GALSU|nr:ribosomal RNA large subunit methyltransferase E [Galdieria sulphuraria]EME28102.1 ribosomal RNA large subunit methyltransferase E [Galdieria sulphuraria]|eukprot:XP_005704622.1 ribosomal RNA large subunit methyltransferase E [Galdieria sulphuraria]
MMGWKPFHSTTPFLWNRIKLFCTASSSRWKIQRRKDLYAQAAYNEGLRSRAAYKLLEMMEQFHFIQQTSVVVDLGAAPGGWSLVAKQYLELCSKVPWKVPLDELASVPQVNVMRSTGRLVRRTRGRLISVDISDMEPIAGATFIQGDFCEQETQQRITKVLYGDEVDVVLSDMCPNTSGVKELDHERIIELAFSASHFAIHHLCNGGTFLCKIFQGAQEKRLNTFLEEHFVQVKRIRPKASKSESSECYILAIHDDSAMMMMSEAQEEREKVYRQCIDTLFSRWTALRLALEHWNRPTDEGQALLETLQQAIIQAAQDNELNTEFLETLFEEAFDILQVDVEDDSIEQVSCLLFDLGKDCLQGNMEIVNTFLIQRPLHTGATFSSGLDSSVSEIVRNHQTSTTMCIGASEESMSTELTTSAFMTDEDGFQRVQRRHRKR